MTDAESDQRIRLLVHVVLPIGTAIWAFSQAPGTAPVVAWSLIALTVVSLAYGCNRLLAMADDRLNRPQGGGPA